VVVPLLDTRWVPSQAFTEIAAATRAGKMALDSCMQDTPAPPIAVAARRPPVAATSPSRRAGVTSEELEEDRGEKKENGADQGRYWLISTAQPS